MRSLRSAPVVLFYPYILLVVDVVRAYLAVNSARECSWTKRITLANRADGLRVALSSSSAQPAPSISSDNSISSVNEASRMLAEWDRYYNQESTSDMTSFSTELDPDATRANLREAVQVLNRAARDERLEDSTRGRCMLGICASSAPEGVAALKSWVSALELPRGLLHGMDKDGIPLEIDSAVYIKYNTGGVLTFSDIRKSGMGFDALWKPGDALLEPYDGRFRGVYFQVELDDGEFRQYLVPLDLFGPL